MQQYWTAFATTGDPNGAGRLRWPTFSAASPTTLMLQPTRLSTVQGYQAKECAVADQLIWSMVGRRDTTGPAVWAGLSAGRVRTGPGERVTVAASEGAHGGGVRRIE